MNGLLWIHGYRGRASDAVARTTAGRVVDYRRRTDCWTCGEDTRIGTLVSRSRAGTSRAARRSHARAGTDDCTTAIDVAAPDSLIVGVVVDSGSVCVRW